DAVAGLYSFRNRDLNPTVGRWAQQDPIGFAGGDVNLYRAEGDNPANGLDPSGLDSIDAYQQYRRSVLDSAGGGVPLSRAEWLEQEAAAAARARAASSADSITRSIPSDIEIEAQLRRIRTADRPLRRQLWLNEQGIACLEPGHAAGSPPEDGTTFVLWVLAAAPLIKLLPIIAANAYVNAPRVVVAV